MPTRHSFYPRPIAAAIMAAFTVASPTTPAAPNGAKAAIVTDATAHTAANRPAAVRVVSTCDDSGAGSLRDAIADAISGDTIDLSQLACSRISLSTGALEIPLDNLTIAGPADHHVVIDGGASANHYGNAIVHSGSGTLTAIDVGVTDAKYLDGAGLGGCIWSNASVTLIRSVVSGCVVENSDGDATGAGVWAKDGVFVVQSKIYGNVAAATNGRASGGGIYSQSGVVVETSTVAGNVIGGDGGSEGGGIFSTGGIYMLSSTVSANEAQFGGGIFIDSSPVTSDAQIFNSTISGNVADTAAGGLFARVSTELVADTFAFNRESVLAGAGAYLEGAPFLENTIMILDTSANGTALDLGAPAGTTASADHLMIAAFSTNISLPPGSVVATGDNRDIGPLADNGGSTLTHALPSISQAIDRGGATNFATDQRGQGFKRAVGSATDIGAFEYDSDLIFVNGFN